MDISAQPMLRFQGVNILRIDFNARKKYDNETPIDLNVQPQVFYPKDSPDNFHILMDVSLICEGFFSLKMLALGIFELGSEANNDDLKKNFVNSNAPAIMFPYVRSFISTLTANIGNVTGALTIPTQFFQGDIPEIKNYEEQ